MRKLYFCRNLEEIKKILSSEVNDSEKVACISIDINEDYSIKAFLKDRSNVCYMNKYDAICDKKEELNTNIRKFIAGLNQNHGDLEWWALSFTSKNPMSPCSLLIERLFSYLVCLTVMDDPLSNDYELLVFVVKDRVIRQQIRAYMKLTQKKAEFFAYDFFKLPSLTSLLPISFVGPCLKILFLKFYAKCTLNFKGSIKKKYVVVHSMIHLKSFLNGEYKDTYFGVLPQKLVENGEPTIVLANVFSPVFSILKKIWYHRKQISIVPVFYWCSTWNLMKCCVIALKKHFVPTLFKTSLQIGSYPVEIIVRNAERVDCKTKRYFLNILFFFIGQGIARNLRVKKYIYPFENRAWERSLLQGLRSIGQQFPIIGYQHSSISKRHWHFMLDPQEAPTYPLPDRVLTNGKVTEAWFRNHFNPYGTLFKSSCAFRYDISQHRVQKKSSIRRLLLPLASSYEEYYKAIFFFKSFSGKSFPYHVTIQPHYLLPSVKPFKNLELPISFSIERELPIVDSLMKTDVLLNISSTACLEALSLGIPVIYLDMPDFCNTDPLFEFQGFKWQAYDESSLKAVLQEIEYMSVEKFMDCQNLGREYVTRYLYPVNRETIKGFLE